MIQLQSLLYNLSIDFQQITDLCDEHLKKISIYPSS